MKCIEGQQKKFCMFKHEWTKFDKRLFPCTSQGAGSDEDWATCVTCLQTERPIKVGEDHECQLCNKEESGEYFRDGKCQTCGSCSILTPVFTFEKFEWEKKTDYAAVLEQWKKVEEDKFKWENRWRYQNVSVTCEPLTRRAMKWDEIAKKINISGVDHYKSPATTDQKRDGKLFTENPVVDFHAMHYEKLEDKKTICVESHCKDFCSD